MTVGYLHLESVRVCIYLLEAVKTDSRAVPVRARSSSPNLKSVFTAFRYMYTHFHYNAYERTQYACMHALHSVIIIITNRMRMQPLYQCLCPPGFLLAVYIIISSLALGILFCSGINIP